MRHGAYILARYSTDNQNADTIEVQVKKCTEWCQLHNLPVLDVFADFAVSGMKDTRREYDRMLQQLRAGGADTVVVYDQSRMFRKMTAWFRMREELEVLGVAVKSVTQPLIGGDLRDPAVFMNEGVTALFSQIHALQTRQKVVEKMRWMAEHGQHTGGKPPLGYDVVDGKLAINEKEAETVRLIFSRYASGVSYRDIIRELNSKGIHTKRGNPFGSNSLHDLLRNERYIGTLVYGETVRMINGQRNSHAPAADDVIKIPGGCPRIIDDDTWNTVRILAAKNKRSGGGRPPESREYPLKGKVFCGECKSALSVSVSKMRYYYYLCNNRKRTNACSLGQIRVDSLEDQVFEAVRGILSGPTKIDRILEIAREYRIEAGGQVMLTLQNLKSDYQDVARQLDAATNAILSGLNSPALLEKVNALERRREELDSQIAQLKRETAPLSVMDESIRTAFLELVNNTYPDRSLLFTLVRRVEVYEDHLIIWTILDPDHTYHPSDHPDYAPSPSHSVTITPRDPSPAPTVIITPHYLIINCMRKNGRN
jgi:site-specific DNA recombinase